MENLNHFHLVAQQVLKLITAADQVRLSIGTITSALKRVKSGRHFETIGARIPKTR
jgi:hypothetical protein